MTIPESRLDSTWAGLADWPSPGGCGTALSDAAETRAGSAAERKGSAAGRAGTARPTSDGSDSPGARKWPLFAYSRLCSLKIFVTGGKSEIAEQSKARESRARESGEQD